MDLLTAQRVFQDLKLAAIPKDLKVTNTLYSLDVELRPELPVAKFLRKLPELQYRLQLPHPLQPEIIPTQAIIRLQAPLAQSTFSFWDHFTKNDYSTEFILGVQANGTPVTMEMSQNPHLLLAGATGSGKSVALHVMIANAILNNHENYLVDPKLIEFESYRNLPQVNRLTHDAEDTQELFEDLEFKMHQRLLHLQRVGKTNYLAYNPQGAIFVFIDELADLFGGSSNLQQSLIKLTQKCRAAGIFIVAATQRPSSDVVSGLLKANFPARIACKTAALWDSRVILDQPGAQNLMGRGDALLTNERHSMLRFQFLHVRPEDVQGRAVPSK